MNLSIAATTTTTARTADASMDAETAWFIVILVVGIIGMCVYAFMFPTICRVVIDYAIVRPAEFFNRRTARAMHDETPGVYRNLIEPSDNEAYSVATPAPPIATIGGGTYAPPPLYEDIVHVVLRNDLRPRVNEAYSVETPAPPIATIGGVTYAPPPLYEDIVHATPVDGANAYNGATIPEPPSYSEAILMTTIREESSPTVLDSKETSGNDNRAYDNHHD